MSSTRVILYGGILAALLTGSAGCNWIIPLAVLGQPPTQKVAAEFDKLAGTKALILVWAEEDTRFDYPNVRLEVGAYVAHHLEAHVEGVHFIPPRQVEDYVESHAGASHDPVAVGRHFGVDRVIHVVLLEFTMRDREMAQFHRGRVRASVAAYDLRDPSGTPQRYALADVFVVYPENRPIGFDANAPTVVRQKTYEAFADAVGRKFYAYEKEI
ncbi:MAG: hypothetical protein JXA69_00665 [Phycisphaerae bacterium]|nr:hypothetical protein [Phycisphaerae bacterium]